MTQAAYSNSPVRPVQLVMFRLAVLLALAATAAAAAVQCPAGMVELTEADLDATVAASGLTILQAGWQQ